MNKETEATQAEVIVPTIKVGRYDLPINPIGGKYVPGESKIIGNLHELEYIAQGVKNNHAVLLIGETGTGKTSFIRHLANLTNNNFMRLNLNGGTTTDELVGHYVVDGKESGMRWVDGKLTEAMRHGGWLLLDELNAGLPEVLFVLQSVLDDDKFLVLSEKDGEVIHAHPEFRLFATMNPSLEYAGTRDLNKALLSRFVSVIQTQYPDAPHEIEIIKMYNPHLTAEDLSLMVRIAEDMRKGKKENSITFTCSTRELINWGKLSLDMGVKDAAELAVLNKCEIDTDRKFVEDLFKLYFGKWEKKEILTITEIERQLVELQKQLAKK